MTCDVCYHPIYAGKFNEGDNFTCSNHKCKAYLRVKKCNNCKFIFMTQNTNTNICEPCQKNPSFTQSQLQPIK